MSENAQRGQQSLQQLYASMETTTVVIGAPWELDTISVISKAQPPPKPLPVSGSHSTRKRTNEVTEDDLNRLETGIRTALSYGASLLKEKRLRGFLI